jgi:hypothetical protein
LICAKKAFNGEKMTQSRSAFWFWIWFCKNAFLIVNCLSALYKSAATASLHLVFLIILAVSMMRTFFFYFVAILIYCQISTVGSETQPSTLTFNLPQPIKKGVTNEGCHVDYKVYVYDIAPYLMQPSIEARRNLTYHICQK